MPPEAHMENMKYLLPFTILRWILLHLCLSIGMQISADLENTAWRGTRLSSMTVIINGVAQV